MRSGVIVLAGVLACGSHPPAAPSNRAGVDEPREEPIPTIEANGATLHRGDRVRVLRWAGTAKPAETGHGEVVITTGATGTFLGARMRDLADAIPSVPIAVVRWDPQRWKDPNSGRDVQLPSFDSAIHPSFLELTR